MNQESKKRKIEAIPESSHGMTLRGASKKYDIPKSSLHRAITQPAVLKKGRARNRTKKVLRSDPTVVSNLLARIAELELELCKQICDAFILKQTGQRRSGGNRSHLARILTQEDWSASPGFANAKPKVTGKRKKLIS